MLLQDILPSGVSAYGVIPFIVILVVSLLCSAGFMKYYWKSHERDYLSAVAATLGLWFALVTSFLLPLDVFLVSFMKHSDGTFKDWATNSTRMSVEHGMSYAYYSLYGVILFFAFFFLPFVYFAYEEKEDSNHHGSYRLWPALGYASVFVLGASVLLIVGAFIPYRQTSGINPNSSEWNVLKDLLSHMYQNRGVDALYFIMNILMLMGLVLLVFYTGIGLSSFPITSVRGWRSIESERDDLEQRRTSLIARKSSLQSKDKLSSRQEEALHELQEEEHLLNRMEHELQSATHGLCFALGPVTKIIFIIFGLIGLALGFLIWLALLLSNIDKLMNSVGFKNGYLLAIARVPNPLDYIMVQCQKVFPLDYIFFFCIIVFLVCCTVGGIRDLGIWCFCIRVFKIRPHKTLPQALIILCVILMYTVLALNYLIYSTLPQYTTFGSQHYRNETSKEVIACSHEAPGGECLMTQASLYLAGFTAKAWIFGMLFYWFTWAFLLFVILGFLWAFLRSKRSFINEAVDRDDFEDSDSDVRPIIA